MPEVAKKELDTAKSKMERTGDQIFERCLKEPKNCRIERDGHDN